MEDKFEVIAGCLSNKRVGFADGLFKFAQYVPDRCNKALSKKMFGYCIVGMPTHLPTVQMSSHVSRIFGGVDSPVLNVFMSEQNRAMLRRAVVVAVHKATGGKVAISEQSDIQMQMVMIRIASEQNGMDRPLADLNKDVVHACKQSILSSIGHYVNYIDSLSADPGIMHRPMSTRDSNETMQRRVF